MFCEELNFFTEVKKATCQPRTRKCKELMDSGFTLENLSGEAVHTPAFPNSENLRWSEYPLSIPVIQMVKVPQCPCLPRLDFSVALLG